MIKPKALPRDGMLGIVSPASTPRPEKVEAGMAALHALGYRTRLFPHALTRGPLFYAGTTGQRLADLVAAFADPEIDAVLCTRGGWGSAELLPLLAGAGLPEMLTACPKPFLGFSDHTSLHLWLRNEAGMISFQAPMVSADFANPEGADLHSWRHALEGSAQWELGPQAGLRVLQPGSAEGELHGGCLAIYAESLGTPWAARPRRGILMLEDVNVKPYQWVRMLVHLAHAGLFEEVTGIVLGNMDQSCSGDEQEALEVSLRYALREFRGPIAIGLRSGHVSSGNITLPFGVRTRLDLTDPAHPRMHFLEPAVTG